jgi:hypothetical protein
MELEKKNQKKIVADDLIFYFYCYYLSTCFFI